MKVAITIPMQDECKAEFTLSLASMVNQVHCDPPPGLAQLGIFSMRTSILPNARNGLTDQVIDLGFTHQLWIDSDMEFPVDMLTRLAAHRKEVVGINAMMRRPPYESTAETAQGVKLETNEHSSGLEKVHRLGTGVLLLDLAVFARIRRRPWFTFEWIGGKRTHRGEDYVFCQRLRKAGATLWVDQDLSKEVGHVGSFSFKPVYTAERNET